MRRKMEKILAMLLAAVLFAGCIPMMKVEAHADAPRGVSSSKTESAGKNRMTASDDMEPLSRKDRADAALWNNGYHVRGDVKYAVFCDTMEDVPKDAWDVSADGDKSVMAWLDRNTLHICANGKVTLNENASWLFSGFSNLREVDFNDSVDTSEVLDMSHFFSECRALETVNLTGIDTSDVENMTCMFYYCNELTSLDLSGFDTSRVKNMNKMFAYCTRLEELDVSGFDTGKVSDMSFMFYHCKSLKTIDVSHFDTSRNRLLNSMFYHCENLEYVDVSGFDTSLVTGMGNMFAGCPKLETPDISNFDLSNVSFYDNFLDNGHTIAGMPWAKYIKDVKAGKITPDGRKINVSKQKLSPEAAKEYLAIINDTVEKYVDYYMEPEEVAESHTIAFLHDLNEDGIPELVVNVPDIWIETKYGGDEPWDCFSVFSYENGRLITRIKLEQVTLEVGDCGGMAGVVNVSQSPVLVKHSFCYDWSLDQREDTYTIYGKDFKPKDVLYIIQKDDGNTTCTKNDKPITENAFNKELAKVGITKDDTQNITLDELIKQLEEIAKVK